MEKVEDNKKWEYERTKLKGGEEEVGIHIV
jgi:hypothetical protein